MARLVPIDVEIPMDLKDSGPAMDPEREAGLTAAAKAGGLPAFLELVRAYQRPVYRLAYALTRSPAEASSLAAEALVQAWLAIDQLPESQPFLPWLLRRTRDLASAAQRGGSAMAAETAVLAAYARLQPDEKMALALRVVEGAGYREIADCLKVSPEVAALKLSNARGLLLSEGASEGEDA